MCKERKFIKAVAFLGLMSALAVVCAGVFPMGLTIRIGEFVKLSPVFIVVALAGNLYGWWGGMLVAFIGDFLQSVFAGLGISPLILIINMLSGACFGWLMHNKVSLLRITVSVLLTQIIGSLCFTTLVLRFRLGIPMIPMIYWRIAQTVILIFAEIILLWLIFKAFNLPQKIKRLDK